MRIFMLLFLLASALVQSQEQLPQNYFQNPLDIPLILSGSFGELRSNHFHSGLDIKTQQRRGLPVYAAADGFVKRIKVAHYGYGKALYIQHPNGYNTVYAHLQRYAGPIQEYVKEQQYAKESFEIELFPDSEVLAVKKGDIIAYSGNSGSSGGPHLHFEIRDAASRPMNPMLFGIQVPDSKPPIINSVYVYPQQGAHVNGSANPTRLRLMLQQDGSYKTEAIEASGTLGFGVSTNDQLDGASNKNGAYTLQTTFNGVPTFGVQFDRFSFAETRYLNRYIDYGHYRTDRERVQKLFRESNNPLSIITQELNSGYIDVAETYNGMYTIEITDFANNKTTITVPITGKKEFNVPPADRDETNDYVYADQSTAITTGKFSVFIPSNALYEDTFLNINSKGDTLFLHEDVVPIHKNISISIDASNYASQDLDKMYIGRLNYRGQPYYTTTYRNGSKLTAKTRTFGNYALATDTSPPTVEAANFKDGQWISKHTTLQLKIEDDLSGIASYRATLNGAYILTEYDYKTDLLTYYFSDNVVSDSENNLKLIVLDNVGNSTTFEATFFRK
ncbi:M23 family metallopeptidase [Altibacter sp. HG106]|uniref:M23 family metallopeptidase n=1 Tax=Altibacter sp. HG106 TaxID=3023937 RepID=UPI0023500D40|nr:M23 family metallopeptidase [Altibacter sp. HG106]MDC7996181.1 M23 family metallopeptidase [Altibacter sp. HG106]